MPTFRLAADVLFLAGRVIRPDRRDGRAARPLCYHTGNGAERTRKFTMREREYEQERKDEPR